MSDAHPSWPPAMTNDPRWSQTCQNGHFSRVRAPQRPRECPICAAPLTNVEAIDVVSKAVRQDRKKRASGDGALFTQGDGRLH